MARGGNGGRERLQERKTPIGRVPRAVEQTIRATDIISRLDAWFGPCNSGSYLFDDFGQPRITSYANNDGWFDDTSDGPVMARLVMHATSTNNTRAP